MPQHKISESVCEKDECFVVKLSAKEDFIDLFEEENINVIILCGKNGYRNNFIFNNQAKSKVNECIIIPILRLCEELIPDSMIFITRDNFVMK